MMRTKIVETAYGVANQGMTSEVCEEEVVEENGGMDMEIRHRMSAAREHWKK